MLSWARCKPRLQKTFPCACPSPRQTLEVRNAAGEVLEDVPGVHVPLWTRRGAGQFAHAARGFSAWREKIGGGAAHGAVFKSRRRTGENGLGSTEADLVLTRILWLEGLEAHNANTRERYIYIHGTNHETLLGQPASHGCVRMAQRGHGGALRGRSRPARKCASVEAEADAAETGVWGAKICVRISLPTGAAWSKSLLERRLAENGDENQVL